MIRLVLIILLILLLIGGLPAVGGFGLDYGYWPSGLLGLILLIVIIAALMGGPRGGPPV